MNRIHWAVIASLGLACWPAAAQTYPSKPIKLVVAFGAGSGNDLTARDLAQAMSETLGQSVVVENRVGGGGAIGTAAVAKAAPDGYTLGLGTSSQLVMNVALLKSLPFDVDKDLRMVGLVSRTPLTLIASASTPSTLPALLAYVKTNPGQLNYGSGGTGSISHIAGEAFSQAAEVKLRHIPYKGNAAALADLSGDHVHLLFDSLSNGLALTKQGRGHVIAVGSSKRNLSAPDVPTFAEQGLPNFHTYTWNGLMVPAKTPPDIVARLNAALNKALTVQAVSDRFKQSSGENLGPSTPEQADAFALAERQRWVPFVRAMRIEEN